jgi:crotonobetainyl-CoA:carnitine CoA-transferase CaiB-like acyl-CoA transferase
VHWSFNRGKRSVVLDLVNSDADRRSLEQLVSGADILIESGEPGELDGLGLGPERLASLNPALVHVSITGFGRTGPKAGYVANDLIVMAAGGYLALTGDEDRAPVRITLPQAYHHAAADAAGGGRGWPGPRSPRCDPCRRPAPCRSG